MKKNFILELKNRNLVQDVTPGLEDLLTNGTPAKAYVGIDPTAESLHIGNYATLMLLLRWQACGHQAIALIGGATGMIGDPSGKSEERNLLSRDVLIHNQERVAAQVKFFLEMDNVTPALVLNNYVWYEHFKLLDFLRDVGKHLTVNYMMAKDSVQKRMETGVSFTEFSYQLFQAYDFYYLYQNQGCQLQMGGSDQWGNITSGTELVRRMCQGSAHGLTTPLLTKADGSKFGKSESGNIWLDAKLTSPYKFYQYLLNASDSDVSKLLYTFSLKEIDDLKAILNQHDTAPELRFAQKCLAEELTVRIHGSQAYQRALEVTGLLFGNATVEGLKQLSTQEFLDVFEGVPTHTLAKSVIEAGINVMDLLTQLKATPSKSEAKRSIQGGGVRINKMKVETIDLQLNASDLLNQKYLLIQIGKKNYYIGIFE